MWSIFLGTLNGNLQNQLLFASNHPLNKYFRNSLATLTERRSWPTTSLLRCTPDAYALIRPDGTDLSLCVSMFLAVKLGKVFSIGRDMTLSFEQGGKTSFWLQQTRIRYILYIFISIEEMFKKQNAVNSVEGSSLRAPWQNCPYKNKHIEQHNTRRTTGRNKDSD